MRSCKLLVCSLKAENICISTLCQIHKHRPMNQKRSRRLQRCRTRVTHHTAAALTSTRSKRNPQLKGNRPEQRVRHQQALCCNFASQCKRNKRNCFCGRNFINENTCIKLNGLLLRISHGANKQECIYESPVSAITIG